MIVSIPIHAFRCRFHFQFPYPPSPPHLLLLVSHCFGVCHIFVLCGAVSFMIGGLYRIFPVTVRPFIRTNLHPIRCAPSRSRLGNAGFLTKCLFTLLGPLNPPSQNSKVMDSPFEFLLNCPQTELRTLSQNCEQTLRKNANTQN